MKRWIVPLMIAALTVGVAHAGNDKTQDPAKGKNQAQGERYDDKGKGDSKGNDPSNRGQVVSECNHRANDKNLKGQERKDYVEWCESRGARYGYKDNDYGRERDCYKRVFERGLTGEKRTSVLSSCLEEADRKYEGGKSKDKKSDGVSVDAAGRDVLGKGKENK